MVCFIIQILFFGFFLGRLLVKIDRKRTTVLTTFQCDLFGHFSSIQRLKALPSFFIVY